MDAATMTATGPTELTRNFAGRYHDLRLVPLTNAAVRLLARFSGPAEEVRQFTLHTTAGLVGNDADGDGLDDLRELDIADASTNDSRVTIHDVLPGDDFDGDGFSNAAELAADSDPTDPRSVPPLDGVQVAPAPPRAFERNGVPGGFAITRAGADPATNALLVRVQVTGSAIPGADYAALPAIVTLPANERDVVLDVVPLADGLAEGDETVTLCLLPDPAYTLGRATQATVTIEDDPYDAWRKRHFTSAQLGQPALSGDTGDPDGDGLPNIGEFGLGLDPWQPDAAGLRLTVERGVTNLNCYLSFDRSLDALGDLFLIESTTNLVTGPWEDITASLQVLARELGLRGETVVLLDTRALTDSPQRYYRLNFQPTATAVVLPWLTITRTDQQVIVSWPLTADGWVLEATNALPGVAVPWPVIPPPYETNGPNLQFIEPAPSGSKFYRLHKP